MSPSRHPGEERVSRTMPLKGALVGWQGSSSADGGGILTGADRISLTRYPENWMEGLYWSWADYARIRAGVGFPRIPVGPSIDRRDLPVAKMPQVPGVGTETKKRETDFLPFPTNRGKWVSETGELPVTVAPTLPKPTVRSSPVPTTGAGLPTTETTGGIMPSVTDFFRGLIAGDDDIFDIGADLYDNFLKSDPPSIPPPLPDPAPTNGTNGGPPMGPMTVGNSCEADPRTQYDMKFICGEWKWVKKRKRRRKRLATSSDIKDLSSLKGVLGGGKSFDLWIATHAN